MYKNILFLFDEERKEVPWVSSFEKSTEWYSTNSSAFPHLFPRVFLATIVEYIYAERYTALAYSIPRFFVQGCLSGRGKDFIKALFQ